MRGKPSDLDILGGQNELAQIPDGDFAGLWQAVVTRIVTTPDYGPLLLAAFPDQPVEAFDTPQFANTLAGFVGSAFSSTPSPFDDFLQGDDSAIDQAALNGADLFYGDAQCGGCHSGSLFSDQQMYNLAIPPIGRGPSFKETVDSGVALRSHGSPEDAFRFRTPRLRHVAHTAPYTHNGAYIDLASVIRHHTSPVESLWSFDDSPLSAEVAELVHHDPEVLAEVERYLSEEISMMPELTDREIRHLIAFMESLSSEALLALADLTPLSVPSGLPMVEP